MFWIQAKWIADKHKMKQDSQDKYIILNVKQGSSNSWKIVAIKHWHHGLIS